MQIALHKNARTTPATRAEIAASKDSVSVIGQTLWRNEGHYPSLVARGQVFEPMPRTRHTACRQH